MTQSENMSKIIIKNARIVNEGKIIEGDLLIHKDRIAKLAPQIEEANAEEINAEGKFLLPGIIDDQVHFREPGLGHKANIYTESCAAVAGGVTTFMEMPNTKPQSVTQELLQKKYDIAHHVSPANYSFFMGATNDNIEEVLKTNPKDVCGVKIFMGSSTGNMLVDQDETLEKLFSKVEMLMATHCEDEATIRKNMEKAESKYGEDIPFTEHPIIRSREACYLSSSKAIALAKKFDARLHILHISTADEIALFSNELPLEKKRITSEACVHHLYFNDTYYSSHGSKVKCNPAIKTEQDRKAIFQAVLDDNIDIIATDHAPHTVEEKSGKYASAPSGLPLVQHSLNIMFHFHQKGEISMERLVEKMCHAPAQCFQLKERGYLREGYFADLVLFDPNNPWTVSKENILYKCAWSPLENVRFKGKVDQTFVNGQLVYANNKVLPFSAGQRIHFNR